MPGGGAIGRSKQQAADEFIALLHERKDLAATAGVQPDSPVLQASALPDAGRVLGKLVTKQPMAIHK